MRDYGKVSPQFWIGATGKALRGYPEAQIVALYLMTCPHATMTGVFHCPMLYIAHETGLQMEGASKGLQRLIEAGFCEYDEASEMVFVVRMAAYQIGESLDPKDRRVIGLRSDVLKMPKGRLRDRFVSVYGRVFRLEEESPEAPCKPLARPFEGPNKPHRSQEQEQEQEEKAYPPQASEDGQTTAAPPAAKADSRGTRLPADWALTPELLEIGRRARADAGLPAIDLRLEAAKFVDFWRAKSGRDAAKLDWPATWRNWCRNATAGKGAPARGADPVFKTPAEVGL